MTPPTPRSSYAGFSMMELVIVLMILVTIAAIALPRLGQGTARTNDQRRIEDLEAVEAALEMYWADHGAYPVVSGWQGDAPEYGGMGYDAEGYIPGLAPDYIQELPRDPERRFPLGDQGYLYRSDGKGYKFLAYKTPSSFPTTHRFYDPKRGSWAYQVSTKDAVGW